MKMDNEFRKEAMEKAKPLIEMLNTLNLSPFEKFLLIHDFCASKPYNLEKLEKRDFVDTFSKPMLTDKIDCIGYASIMSEICKQVGINCLEDGGRFKLAGHQFNIVFLDDPKYKINDWFLCDACWDYQPYAINKGLLCYAYAAFPIQDIKFDDHQLYFIRSKWIMKNPKTNTNTPISMETFEKALKNAYGTILGYNEIKKDKNVFNKIIKHLKSTPSKDDILYNEFQDGKSSRNYEYEYYEKRIEDSLELTKKILTKHIQKPSKQIECCFYSHKDRIKNDKQNEKVMKR